MAGTFLEPYARLLVLLHAAAAIVLIGSSTHHLIIALASGRGRYRVRLARLYALVGACAYGVTFALGALAYPTYRYHVRGLYLDRNAEWASNLFDIKENFAAIGLPLVVGALVMSRVVDAREDHALRRGYVVMVALVAFVVWFSVVSGLVITLVKGP
jgi:hypothetical protein